MKIMRRNRKISRQILWVNEETFIFYYKCITSCVFDFNKLLHITSILLISLPHKYTHQQYNTIYETTKKGLQIEMLVTLLGYHLSIR